MDSDIISILLLIIPFTVVLFLMLGYLESIELKKEKLRNSKPIINNLSEENISTNVMNTGDKYEVTNQVEEAMEEVEVLMSGDLKETLEVVKSLTDFYELNNKEVPEEIEFEIDDFEEKYNSLYEAFESLKQEAEELKIEMDGFVSDVEYDIQNEED